MDGVVIAVLVLAVGYAVVRMYKYKRNKDAGAVRVPSPVDETKQK
jgi:hypothetical protein